MRALRARPALWLILGIVACIASVATILARFGESSGDLLAVLSTVVAGVFAVLATSSETRRDGRLTSWGWISLFGVATSITFALALKYHDTSAAESSARAAEERYESAQRQQQRIQHGLENTLRMVGDSLASIRDTLHRTQDVQQRLSETLDHVRVAEHKAERAAYPLVVNSLSLTVTYSADSKPFTDYLDRLRTKVANHSIVDHGVSVVSGGTEKSLEVEIRNKEADAFPQKQHGEQNLQHIFQLPAKVVIALANYKKRVPLPQYTTVLRSDRYFFGWDVEIVGEDCIDYLVVRLTGVTRISHVINCNKLNVDRWTNVIQSPVDLPGTTLDVLLQYPSPTFSEVSPRLSYFALARSRQAEPDVIVARDEFKKWPAQPPRTYAWRCKLRSTHVHLGGLQR